MFASLRQAADLPGETRARTKKKTLVVSKDKTVRQTPRILSVNRIVAVVVLFAAAVVTWFAMGSVLHAVERVSINTGKSALANNFMSNINQSYSQLVFAKLSATQDANYQQTLSQASADLSQLLISADDEESQKLADIFDQLVAYSAQLGELNQTDQPIELVDQIKTQREQLISDSMELLSGYSVKAIDARWLVVVLAIPMLVLIWASVRHAQATRRVINFGLLIALALSGLAWYLVSDSVISSQHFISVKQSDEVVSASMTAVVSSSVAAVQAYDAEIALRAANDPANEQIDQLTKNASINAAFVGQSAEQPYLGQLSSQIADYTALHYAFLEDSPADQGAKSIELSQKGDELIAAMSKQIEQSKQQLVTSADAQANADRRIRYLAVALMVAAGFASAIGLGVPLRKYR